MAATMQGSEVNDRIFLAPRVPQGLAAAVEGLTREVIRHRPENIYVFAAHHFEKLLRIREEYGSAPVNKKSDEILHDMNEAIKERQVYLELKETNNLTQETGWTFNETAKVLERHRSIFGDTGQKISIEQVRELANESILTSNIQESTPRNPRKNSERYQNKNMTDRYATTSSSKKRESQYNVTQDLPGTGLNKNDSRSVPKIISQIPLAKDIKTELKKNRISSKERKKIDEKKMQVACEYSREMISEKTIRRSVEKTKRSGESRSEQRRSSQTEDSPKRDKTDKTDSPRVKRSSRSVSMDRVKSYVVQNFVGMSSLDELQTPSYVEKVQEVINETSTIIKEKVEALKTGVVKAARAKQAEKERSLSSDEQSKASNKSADSNKKSDDESLWDPSSSRSLSKNTELSKNVHVNDVHSKSLNNDENSLDQFESKNSDNSDASNDSKISLPVVRTPSSKSTSRSLSARSHSDGLILPPISPESIKSPKMKEELVLPVLSSLRNTTITPDESIDPINYNEKNVQGAQVNSDEEFQDSLNVTPELDGTPQRPDSLETSEIVDKSDSSGHVSPLETLKDKLLEIEQVQKSIEGVLDDTISKGNKITEENKINDETRVSLNIQEKLEEIEESERRIEQILDSQSSDAGETEVTANIDIKSKLQELEDAEKRIENIFINEADKECSNYTDTRDTNTEQKDNLNYNIDENINNSGTQQNLENAMDDNSLDARTDGNNPENIEDTNTVTETNRILSPYSYILTEGSPYDIPDSVTTVIIPDRITTPDSDTLHVELEDGEVYSTLMSSKEINVTEDEGPAYELHEGGKNNIHDAFGEIIDTNNTETSTVEIDYIRGIKVSHDKIMPRQDLDLIQEEHDRETEEIEVIDSEDEKVLKVVTSSLEEILEKKEVEYVSKEEVQKVVKTIYKDETDDYSPGGIPPTEYESTDETKETSITDGFVENTDVAENSLDIEETTARSAESTNEIKETSATTDRSSLSFDPALPVVPELNLDSLPDLTISSFNITDDEQKEEKEQKEDKDSSLSDVPVSSGSTKGDLSADRKAPEEKLSTEADIKEDKLLIPAEVLESNQTNIMIAKEDFSDKLEETSNADDKDEFLHVKKFQEEYIEQVETEEYEKLEESLESNRYDTTKNLQTIEQISVVENENIQDSHYDQINVSVHSDVEVVNINKTTDTVPDDINTCVCDETGKNKQTSESASESQNNLLTQHCDDAEPLRELENDSQIVEKNYLGVIDNDQNTQLIDSSRASSQCTTTRRLDSDDVSIKTNADEIPLQNNQSQDANTIREDEQTITKKSSNNDIQEFHAGSFVKEEILEHFDDGSNEKKHYDIYVPEINSSKDLMDSSSTESSTFMSAATKIQSGVRGFLIRRRLQSSQRRSSTLDSVPSIQESFAAESSATAETTGITRSVGSSSHLMTIVEAALSISESKTRKKLRREDAVQRTTLSVENAFAENQIQHTGEFHDCIPLPVLDRGALVLKIGKEQEQREKKVVDTTNESKGKGDKDESVAQVESLNIAKSPNVEQLLGNILLGHAASAAHFPGPSKLGQFLDVVLLPGDTEAMLQSRYLNFITSVEDVTNELFNDSIGIPDTPKGVIIEEITSLDEVKDTGLASVSEDASINAVPDDVAKDTKNNEFLADNELAQENPMTSDHPSSVAEEIESQSSDVKTEPIDGSDEVSPILLQLTTEGENEVAEGEETASLAEASISISDDPLSINIEQVLGLEEEDDNSLKTNKSIKKLTTGDLLRSSSISQESHLSDERIRSPVTMMQIALTSVEEKSEKPEKSGDEENNKNNKKEALKEDSSVEEKEQESPNQNKTDHNNASSS